MKNVAVVLMGGLLFLGCGASQGETAQELRGSLSLPYCTALTQCSNGSTIHCEGNTSCTVSDGTSINCDGAVTACPVPTCGIGGVSYANGTPNPSNPCQYCDTSVSTTSWTNMPDQVLIESSCKQTSTCGAANQCKGRRCDPNGTWDECTSSCRNGRLVCG